MPFLVACITQPSTQYASYQPISRPLIQLLAAAKHSISSLVGMSEAATTVTEPEPGQILLEEDAEEAIPPETPEQALALNEEGVRHWFVEVILLKSCNKLAPLVWRSSCRSQDCRKAVWPEVASLQPQAQSSTQRIAATLHKSNNASRVVPLCMSSEPRDI